MAIDTSTAVRDHILNKWRAKNGGATAEVRDGEEEKVMVKADPDFIEPESTTTVSSSTAAIWYSDTFTGAKEYLAEFKHPDIDISSLILDEVDWQGHEQFIPTLDKHYVWQHKVLYPAIQCLLGNMKVLTVGPTGSGKTTFWENLAAIFNQPFYRLGGRRDMESDTILGRPDVDNGSTEFLLGEFPKAFTAGYMILLDEIWKLPSGINMALQRVFERNGMLQIDDMKGELADKQFKAHEFTHIVLADNVVGTGDGADKYAATEIQDGSTLNRMDMILELGYLSPEDEVKMLMDRYSYIPKKRAEKAVQLANLIRNGFESGQLSATMSPRNLTAWMEMAYKVKDYNTSFKWIMLNRFAEDDEKATVVGMWKTVHGDDL